jgi:hypothetical protein
MSSTGGPAGEPDQDSLREALKHVAVALKETGAPFALMGGYAAWARGGPESAHDVDFLVAEPDAPMVRESLVAQGLEVLQAPEDWLFKVAVQDAVVDIIFRVTGHAATREVVEEADDLEVLSVIMPVLSATEILVQKMHTLSEHYCDFGAMIPTARALREQVDWDRVARETGDNPFADALLYLLGRLEVIAPRDGS